MEIMHDELVEAAKNAALEAEIWKGRAVRHATRCAQLEAENERLTAELKARDAQQPVDLEKASPVDG